jgi:hypothetical protein
MPSAGSLARIICLALILSGLLGFDSWRLRRKWTSSGDSIVMTNQREIAALIRRLMKVPLAAERP